MQAAIFDLDGTMVDSMGVWLKINRDFIIERNLPVANIEEVGLMLKSMNYIEIAEFFIKKFGLPETSDELISIWSEMAYREYTRNVQMKEGVKPFLIKLRSLGLKMGVATTTKRRIAESVLERHNILTIFNTLVTFEEIGIGKENPDIFLVTAAKLKVEPEKCIVFEDSLHAVKGAKKAGMKVFGVFDHSSAHEKDEILNLADGYIHSFEELLDKDFLTL
jgi:HAD superfamily hydrolase (TIGR01509 family)